MRKLALVVALAVVVAGVSIAQRSTRRPHPNLSAAQRYAAMALKSINAAEKAGEWDADGHAAKAKDLLDQANDELKQATRPGHKVPQ